MKTRILGLLAVGLIAGPVTANAVTQTYDFTANNLSIIAGSTPVPFSPVSGSFSLDGSTLVGIDLTIGSKVYSLSDVGTQLISGFRLIGGLISGIPTVTGSSHDFFLAYDTANLSFTQFAYSVQGIDSIWSTRSGTVSLRQEVPEPGTLALLGLGLAGLGVSRRRKAA